jgi:hypothetical protein
MKRMNSKEEDRYEIVIRKYGDDQPIETDVMGDRETQEILHLIGELNLRSAFAG